MSLGEAGKGCAEPARAGQSRPEPARRPRPTKSYVSKKPARAGKGSSEPGISTALRVRGPPQKTMFSGGGQKESKRLLACPNYGKLLED